jgi:importin-7
MDLKDAFLGSLAPETQTRQAAGQFLVSIEDSVGTALQCLDLIFNDTLSPQNLQAVAIYVKNGISRGKLATDPQERLEFKSKLLRTMAKAPLPVQKVLATVVSMLLTGGAFPESWPDLLPTITTMLENPDPCTVHAAILCIIEVPRYYRWQGQLSTVSPISLNDIVSNYSSKLISIASPLIIQHSNESAGEMVWKILKFFHVATARELVEPLQRRELLDMWIELFLRILNRQPLSLDEPTSSTWKKCEKWALKNINTLFIRYASVPSDQFVFVPVYESFQNTFTFAYAPEILKHYLSQVEEYAQHNRTLEDSSKRYLLQFFKQCISVDSLWELLLSKLELVFVSLVLDVIRLKESDIQDIDTEPDQFIYTHNDSLQGGGGAYETSQLVAISFVKDLFRYRSHSVFNGVLIIINQAMESHRQEPQSFEKSLDKDSALRIMCAISQPALDPLSPICAEMEHVVSNYVLPDFRSPFKFLRARACEIIQNYSEVSYSLPVISQIYDGIIHCLLTGNMVISLEAALALHKLVVLDYVKIQQTRSIRTTMEKMLSLCTSDTGSELLSNVMVDFVEIFSGELLPFATQLCNGLSGQVMENLVEIRACNNDDDKVDYAFIDDKVNACQSIMNTILTIVFTMDGHNEPISETELTVSPFLTYIFERSEIELYAESFELIDSFVTTKKSVSDTIWKVFEAAYGTFKREPENCIAELLPCMHNFALYGLSQRLDYLSFFEEVANYGANDEGYEKNRRNGLELLTIIAIRSGEDNFQFNHNLLDVCCAHLQQRGFVRPEMNLILSLLFSDTTRTLSTLNHFNCLDALILNRFSSQFVNNSERRVFALAGLKLLSMNDLPTDSINRYLPTIFQNIVKEVGVLQQCASPGPQTSNSSIPGEISFVDESQGWEQGFSTYYPDDQEESLSLQRLLESYDILGLYRSTIRYLMEQKKGDYEALEASLSNELKSLHFMLLSQV